MKFLRISLSIALIICCCSFDQAAAIDCYVCDGVQNCEMAATYQTCTPELASYTTSYLSQLYNLNATALTGLGISFSCMADELIYGDVEYYYLGCIYNNLAICNMNVIAPAYGYNRQCYQCYSDGCNSASSLYPSVFTVFTTILLGTIAKFSKQ